MPRRLVIHPETGRLSAVVESYQDVELAQLQADVDSKQEVVNNLRTSADAIAQQLSEAQADLEDSKSEYEMGTGLVAVPTTTDEGGDGVDGEVADNY